MSTGISVDLRVCLYIFVSRIRPSVGISVHFFYQFVYMFVSLYIYVFIYCVLGGVPIYLCSNQCILLLVVYPSTYSNDS